MVANKDILLLNNAEYILKLQRARCFIESSSLNFYKVTIVLICGILETVFSAIIIGRISIVFMFLFLVMGLLNNCTIKKSCELKVCTTKKPENPSVFLTLPVAHELSVLCMI